MKPFMKVYGIGLLLLGPALIIFGILAEPSGGTHKRLLATLIGFNSIVIGGFLLLQARRKR